MKPPRMALACAVLAALLVAAPAAIGSADGDRIINGSPANQGEYPAQGFLQINTDADPEFEAECGGTLLGRLWFLTAAHCVVGSSPADLRIYMGDADLTAFDLGTFFSIAVIDIHSGYDDPTNRNDLAMLTLATPAPFEPLRVVRTNESARWAGGTLATIIGWGQTEDGNPSSVSNALLEANVPIIGDDQCTGQYGGGFDANTMVCAHDGVHDTCQGDSGGPLMVPNPAGGFVLAGVTSWGFGCAHPDFAGVYARLGGAAPQRVGPGAPSLDDVRRRHRALGPGNDVQPDLLQPRRWKPVHQLQLGFRRRRPVRRRERRKRVDDLPRRGYARGRPRGDERGRRQGRLQTGCSGELAAFGHTGRPVRDA